MHAECPEEAGGNTRTRHRFRASRCAQQKARAVVRIESREGAIHARPITEVLQREVRSRMNFGALADIHQACGIRVGQRLQQRSIDKTEDSHAGAHSEREDENGHARRIRDSFATAATRSGYPAEPSRTEAHHLMTLLVQPRRIAKLTPCRVARLLGRHPAPRELLLRLRPMELHLLIKFAAEALA